MIDKLGLLKKLHQNKSAVSTIENFISDKYRSNSYFSSKSSMRIYYRQISKDFISLCEALNNECAIEIEAMTLFFSLDKKIYPKIMNLAPEFLINRVRLLPFGDVTFSGESVDIICKSLNDDIFYFLNDHLYLFPKSSQHTISKRLENYKLTINLKIFTNDFERRAFAMTLDKKANLPFLKSYHYKIKNSDISELSLQTDTLLFFYSSIKERYQNHQNNQAYFKFIKDLFNQIKNRIVNASRLGIDKNNFDYILNNYPFFYTDLLDYVALEYNGGPLVKILLTIDNIRSIAYDRSVNETYEESVQKKYLDLIEQFDTLS